MSFIADLVASGYRPRRHPEFGIELAFRSVGYAARIDGRDQFGRYLVADGTAGDEQGGVLWPASSAPAPKAEPMPGVTLPPRDLPSWGDAWPAVLVKPALDEKGTGVGRGAARPLGDERLEQDARFVALEVFAPSALPAGTRGVVVAATHEHRQVAVFMPAEQKLVAVNAAGDPAGASIVHDLRPDNSLDPERSARLHSMMRVVRPRDGLLPFPRPGESSALAWQLAPAGRDSLPGRGLIVDVIGEAVAPPEPEATAPRDVPSPTGTRQRTAPDLPGGVGRTRDRAAPPGGVTSRPRTPPGGAPLAIGVTTARGGGPFEVGDGGDQHHIATTLDGEPINSTHLSTLSLFRGTGGDAPLDFTSIRYSDPSGGPMRTPVHLRLKPDQAHRWPLGDRAGMWKWEAESAIAVVPKDDFREGGPEDDVPPGGPPTSPPPDRPRTGPVDEGGDDGDDGTTTGGGDGTTAGRGRGRGPTSGSGGSRGFFDPRGRGGGTTTTDRGRTGGGGPLGKTGPPGGTPKKPPPPKPRGRGAIGRTFPFDIRLDYRPRDRADRHEPFAASTLPLAAPAMLFQAQRAVTGAPDVRKHPGAIGAIKKHLRGAAMVARLEATATTSGAEQQHTTRPSVGRWPGGNATGAVGFFSPDVDPSDAGATSTSTATFYMGPGTRFGFGSPSSDGGSVVSGYRQYIDSTGALQVDGVNSSGAFDSSRSVDSGVNVRIDPTTPSGFTQDATLSMGPAGSDAVATNNLSESALDWTNHALRVVNSASDYVRLGSMFGFPHVSGRAAGAGAFRVAASPADALAAGRSIEIEGSAAAAGSGLNGGNVQLQPGAGNGAGVRGITEIESELWVDNPAAGWAVGGD